MDFLNFEKLSEGTLITIKPLDNQFTTSKGTFLKAKLLSLGDEVFTDKQVIFRTDNYYLKKGGSLKKFFEGYYNLKDFTFQIKVSYEGRWVRLELFDATPKKERLVTITPKPKPEPLMEDSELPPTEQKKEEEKEIEGVGASVCYVWHHTLIAYHADGTSKIIKGYTTPLKSESKSVKKKSYEKVPEAVKKSTTTIF